ncbi:glucosaminidase domain-containing protein [Cohnella sp. GCM10027633]|uniref:glucosaminidase domain-containing protein n=1 Tax=unclassified Cohnella TaxID=2636738 RepID=UPI00363957C5
MRSEHRQSIAYSISVVLLLCLGFYLLISIYDHANAASEARVPAAIASENQPQSTPSETPTVSPLADSNPTVAADPAPSTHQPPIQISAQPQEAATAPPVTPARAALVLHAMTTNETYPELPKTHTYETTAYFLNVREEPYAKARIVTVLEQGTIIEVLETTDNGWLKLNDGGYVHGGYAKLLDDVVRIASFDAPAEASEAASESASASETANETERISERSTERNAADAPSQQEADSAEEDEEPNKPSSAVSSDSGLSAEDIANILDGTDLAGEGLEEVILDVEAEYGVNAYFTIAVMKLESGNGESRLAKNKNNLFGLNAIAGDAFNQALSFETKADCVRKFGQLIADNYVGRGYTTVEKIAKKYCPANSKWPSHVKTIMKRDYERI